MKRILIPLAVAVLVGVAGTLAFFALTNGGQPTRPIDGVRLVRAIQVFAEDMRSRGEAVPKTVPVKELTRRGLLSEADLGDLAGCDIEVHLDVDERRPQEVLVRVRLPDRTQLVVLADGSVQQRRD